MSRSMQEYPKGYSSDQSKEKNKMRKLSNKKFCSPIKSFRTLVQGRFLAHVIRAIE